MGDIVGDLTCVMKHAGVDEAICVGYSVSRCLVQIFLAHLL